MTTISPLDKIQKNKTFQYITTESDLARVDKDLADYCKLFEKDNRKPKLTVDLETYQPQGKRVEDINCIKRLDGDYDGRIRLLLLGLDPTKEDCQYIIDVMLIGEEVVSKYMNKYLENCLLIGQNLYYDLPFIIEFFKVYPKCTRCLMSFSQSWFAGDRLSIKGDYIDDRSHKLTSHYRNFLDFGWFRTRTGMTFDEYESFKNKHQSSNWGNRILDEDQLKYAADDVSLTHFVYVAMLKKLEDFMRHHNKTGMLNTFKLESDAQIEFGIMSLVGVPYDLQYAEDVVDPYLRGKLQEAEYELSKFPEFWEEIKNETTQIKLMDGSSLKFSNRKVSVPYSRFINLGSKAGKNGPGQLQRALSRAGLDLPNCQQKTFEVLLYDTGKASKLTDKQKSILFNVLKWVKAKGSLLDRYGVEALQEHLHDDGRFYPKWFQIGTDTHRTTCKNPPLQTIPGGDDFFEDGAQIGKMIRRCVAAPPGKKIVVADWSNQEVRLAYQVCQDEYLKTVFLENRDQHSEFAKEAFGLDYFPTKQNGGDMRQAGKTAFLQHQYLGGWRATREAIYIDTKCRLLLSDDEAKNLKQKLKERYSGLTRVAEECKREVLKALEPYQSLREFENRKDIFIGFTRLKYHLDDGTKKSYTRIRRWLLTKEQEKLIKRTKNKEDLNSWIVKSKKSLYFLKRYFNPAKRTAICDNRFGKLKIERKCQFKFVDVLHRNYEKVSEDGSKSTWNNEFNRRVSEIVREYFNFLMQPEGATMLKLSMIMIGREFRSRGWDPKKDASMIAECHDSIISECREEIAEEVKEIKKRCMEKAASMVIRGIPAPVSIKIADNWGDAE